MLSLYGDSESDSPLLRPHELDSIPLQPMAQEVGELVNLMIEVPFKYEQLRSPQLYSMLVRPVVDRVKRDYLNGAIFYCLMANRIRFQSQKDSDLANNKLWITRAMVCEVMAIKLISEFEPDQLAQNLVFEFYPMNDGKIATTSIVPNWLRASCLELAIHSDAKSLLSNPVVVKIIQELWDGTLVFDPLIFKAHKLGLSSKQDLMNVIDANRGLILRYDLQVDVKFKLSRLRVPRYRNIMKFTSVLVLVFLYVSNLQDFNSRFTVKEYLFLVWVLGFSMDEFISLKKAGTALYFQTLWSAFDFGSAVILMLYALLRVLSLVDGFKYLNWYAYQSLSLAGVLLIPRVFSFLDQSEGFSSMMISARKMSIDLLYCWIAIMIFSMGFWASLTKFADGTFTPQKVLYDQVQVLFGFTPAVWTTWQSYTPLGSAVLFLYLFIVQFVVVTMVIAALSARYMEIKTHAVEEYHYVQTIRTLTKLKSERSTVFFYAEPFNLLGWFVSPLVYVLPVDLYLYLNRGLMRLTHFPILVCIYLYEQALWKISLHKRQAEEEQQDELRETLKKVQALNRDTPKPRAGRNWIKRDRKFKFDRSMARASKFDLVEGALDVDTFSEDTAPAWAQGRQSFNSDARNYFNSTPRKSFQRRGTDDSAEVPEALTRSYLKQQINQPVRRGRSYSNASGFNPQSIRLSPTSSYRNILHSKVFPTGNSDSENDDYEEDDLYSVLQDMDERNKKIERMLSSLIGQSNASQHVDLLS